MAEVSEDTLYWVWFSCLYNLGIKKLHLLMDRFVTPNAVWHATAADMKHVTGISDEDVARLKDPRLRDEAAYKLEWLIKNNIAIIKHPDADYPKQLADLPQRPFILYVKGELPDIFVDNRKTIGIVGSRKPTSYGAQTGYTLAYQLARHEITVISGMAKGIDTCAHAGALKAGGKTVAVLGCGLDKPYPAENKALMERITACGAVITEYPPGTPPIPYNFPARNRIISALSKNVLIIEAGKRSGALITAEYAMELGRDVFAVPGNITSKLSEGTNKLIQDGAKIITCAGDILEEYKNIGKAKAFDSPELLKLVYSPSGELDKNELSILEYLTKAPSHIDAIAEKLGYTVSKTGSLLLLMELKGIVEQLPGYVYRLDTPST